MAQEKVRVLIVDDTAFYRKIIKDVLMTFPDIEVIGSAPNGKIALDKIRQLNPDIITLDIEMPEMDGLETLRRLKVVRREVMAVMVSSHTKKGAKITMEALELGAFDFIAKPDSADLNKNIEDIKSQFKPVINAFLTKRAVRSVSAQAAGVPNGVSSAADIAARMSKITSFVRPKIVAVGISTGGPQALAEVIPKLPGDLSAPVVIVQHMPPVFTKALAESLDKKSAVNVTEGKSGQVLEPASVYIAPGGSQMKVVSKPGTNKSLLAVTGDPPENHCKPSADYLFRSVANLYKNRSLGVIMTGMGADGALGLRLMKRNGCRVIAQDQQSCVVYGMPMEAVKAGVVDIILPLNQIAGKITQIVKGV